MICYWKSADGTMPSKDMAAEQSSVPPLRFTPDIVRSDQKLENEKYIYIYIYIVSNGFCKTFLEFL